MIRPDDGTPPGDPFWDVVHQRHPDIDIIILPPEPAEPAEIPVPISSRDHRLLARGVQDLFTQMVDLLLPGQSLVAVPLRWEGGAGTGAPARSARVEDLEPEEARQLVTVADAALTARAWRVTPPNGAFHRVTAIADDMTVTLSAHQGLCRLEVRGPDVALGRDELRLLRQEARA